MKYNKKKYCSEECAEMGGICDFCKYYDFDNGWCKLHKEHRTGYDSCDDFVCFLIGDKKQ